jgi:hypothetical protein
VAALIETDISDDDVAEIQRLLKASKGEGE